MCDQPNADPVRVDAAILGLLLDPNSQRPWSVEEVAREIGDEIATADGLARLTAAGLAHRIAEGFVWASRAALHAESLPT